MSNHTGNLDNVLLGLEHINSLLEFFNDYFDQANPDGTELKIRYKMYADLFYVVCDLMDKQIEEIAKTSDALYKIYNAVEAGAS